MSEKVEVKFAKVHPNAIIPTKREEDMGADIYVCFDEDYMFVAPHETKLIPTGIASACDSGYGFVLKERGSTGSKGIALRCGVIDSGYRNEWFVGLCNTTNKYLCISKLSNEEIVNEQFDRIKSSEEAYNSYLEAYDNDDNIKMVLEAATIFYPYTKAIAQALLIPVPKVEIEEISYDELKEIESERGMGKLGSSGK